jgi:hypothetical protein
MLRINEYLKRAEQKNANQFPALIAINFPDALRTISQIMNRAPSERYTNRTKSE